MPRLSKLLRVSRLALSNPSEFKERVAGRLDRSLERRAVSGMFAGAVTLDDAATTLDQKTGWLLRQALAEPVLAAVEQTVEARITELQRTSPMPPQMDADTSLARFCYAICRVMKPSVVIETGVASGITTTFVLAALEANGGEGRLWSVDLPPLAVDASLHVGAVVPQGLRQRWKLRFGSSKTILPKVLAETGTVDVFVHDSLHTRRNMLRELGMAWPRLRGGGVLVADDVSMNTAFAEFCGQQRRGLSLTVRQKGKDSRFGLILKESRCAQGGRD